MKLSCVFLFPFFACTPTVESNQAATPVPPPATAVRETTAVKPIAVLPSATSDRPQPPAPVSQRPKATVQVSKAPTTLPPPAPAVPQAPVAVASPSLPLPAAAPSHAAWDALLKQFVSETGKVNYKALQNNKTALEAYLKTLSDQPPQDNWSRTEKMAYWINAYNAFTIHLIVENYPTASILKLDGGKTWDVKRIALGDKKYSLNQIENDILRPQFKDARIHFALNCAAKSCPPLYNRAFTAETLETTLEARTKAFLNNPRFNTITPAKATVSKIFEWYAADFGDLPKFLNRYVHTPLKSEATIVYQEYDWDLNE